jgi:hypothetical protein
VRYISNDNGIGFFRAFGESGRLIDMTRSATESELLNDTTIGGTTTIVPGVKCVVVYQLTAIRDEGEAPASYRFDNQSVVVATATDQ